MATKKILSIDGGGIRGIVAAEILSYLETQKQERDHNPNYRLMDSFDLIAGTSTGAIIALGLLTPNKRQPNRPKFLAKELGDLYKKHGRDIFDTNCIRKPLSNIYNEVYGNLKLKKHLDKYFSNTLLSDLLKPCLITAYNIFGRSTCFFNSIDAKNSIYAGSHNFQVQDIALATSAAPTYFEAANIKSEDDVFYPFIDGGVFANNPAACALVELIDMGQQENEAISPDLSNITIVSIGTGKSIAREKKYTYEEVKTFGKLQWASPIVDIMMSSSSEIVDYQLKTIYKCTREQGRDNYFRIQPDLNKASSSMDDVTKGNIDNLYQDARIYISKNINELNRIIDVL